LDTIRVHFFPLEGLFRYDSRLEEDFIGPAQIFVGRVIAIVREDFTDQLHMPLITLMRASSVVAAIFPLAITTLKLTSISLTPTTFLVHYILS
jgi:hypothetical protein